jgi:hypothetical protein
MEVLNRPDVAEFTWEKQGRIFVADGRYEWMQAYAQVPSPLLLEDRIRIYFTCRPAPEPSGDYVSYTTFLDVDRDNPKNILYVHDRPILPLGESGTFDEFGVMPCCVLRKGTEVWLYYVGWARTRGVPWQSSVGLAISEDGGTSFKRYARGPIVTRTPREPFVHGSPFVLPVGDRYHLWYLAGTAWVNHSGRMESIYRLFHALSDDGVEWQRDGIPSVPTLEENECQARPAVLHLRDCYHMWFSYRHGVDFRNPQRGYGIGYAWSNDLVTWHRADSLGGLTKSAGGWDSEMVSYPSVLQVDGSTYLFYCGNHMGREGFGYARLANSIETAGRSDAT